MRGVPTARADVREPAAAQDAVTGGLGPPYLFSKSAIGHATATLAHELLPLGVRVNGIAPGASASRHLRDHAPAADAACALSGWFDTEVRGASPTRRRVVLTGARHR